MTALAKQNGHTALATAVDALEQAIATRDAALELLQGYVRDDERDGGYMNQERQGRLRLSRALLVECGK